MVHGYEVSFSCIEIFVLGGIKGIREIERRDVKENIRKEEQRGLGECSQFTTGEINRAEEQNRERQKKNNQQAPQKSPVCAALLTHLLCSFPELLKAGLHGSTTDAVYFKEMGTESRCLPLQSTWHCSVLSVAKDPSCLGGPCFWARPLHVSLMLISLWSGKMQGLFGVWLVLRVLGLSLRPGAKVIFPFVFLSDRLMVQRKQLCDRRLLPS